MISVQTHLFGLWSLCVLTSWQRADRLVSGQHQEDTHRAKLLWPRFGPRGHSAIRPTYRVAGCRCSLVHSCLPDLGHKKALAIPHVNQRWPKFVLCYSGHFRFTSRLHFAWSTIVLGIFAILQVGNFSFTSKCRIMKWIPSMLLVSYLESHLLSSTSSDTGQASGKEF